VGRARIDDLGLGDRLRTGKPVTLVLGAGVSYGRGLPLWSELLRRTWRTVFGHDPQATERNLLARARRVCLEQGLPEQFVERLDLKRHPLEPQFGFERIYDALRWQADDEKSLQRFGRRRARRLLRLESHEERVAELFADIVRDALYRDAKRIRREGPADTLRLVGRAVRRNATRPEHERRITRVVTFNVDDLLEREVNAGCRRRVPWGVPISRASALRPLPSPRSLGIYHLHGFVPQKAGDYPLYMNDGFIEKEASAAESLVFTDEQYWRSIGGPFGFASRVFLNALNGSCVFVGLSMTDINILRWLATDAIERGDDFRRMFRRSSGSEAAFEIHEDLSRHYWITEGPLEERNASQSIEPDLLTWALGIRGVKRIAIPAWTAPEFHHWWRSCFEE
jgi:hypothetical protein